MPQIFEKSSDELFQTVVAGFSEFSGVGPELGRKLTLFAVALTRILCRGKNPRDDADLFDLMQQKLFSSITQSG